MYKFICETKSFKQKWDEFKVLLQNFQTHQKALGEGEFTVQLWAAFLDLH